MINLVGNVEIMVDGPAAKFELENGLVVVVSHASQQAGLHRYAILQEPAVR